jgi:hypothetical protein
VNSHPKGLWLFAELVHSSNQVQRYKVSGKNRSIIIQTDYPLQQSKGARNIKGNWRVIEGDLNNPYLLGRIGKAIERQIIGM